MCFFGGWRLGVERLRKKKLAFFTSVALSEFRRNIMHNSSSKYEIFSRDEDFKLDFRSFESKII